MHTDFIKTPMLGATVSSRMKVYKDYNNFSINRMLRPATVLFAMLGKCKHEILLYCTKKMCRIHL